MPENSNQSGTVCPRAEVWLDIAAGLAGSEQTLTCVEHASGCERCGPLLHNAVSEFTDLCREISDEERQLIASLESSSPEWQMSLARRIAGSTPVTPAAVPGWQRWLTARALGLAAAMVLAAVTTGWWFLTQHGDADSANRYLASAYTTQRTLELRIPGAEYGPLRVQKGPAESFVARSPMLLKAEALIADQLSKHPDEPIWLQAAARADLLEGKYDAAVESLRRAIELKPNSADLLLDLGTAYFQRAQSEDRREDYSAAFEYLSEMLKQQPDNPAALFNRAIVAEHQFLYRQALADWEHYLRIDTNSSWAEEARSHADAVREKLKEHQSDARPLLTPKQITPAARNDIERRPERYLDAAVRTWLPQAFPVDGKPTDLQVRQALFFLADLTSEQQHSDSWLADLLKGSSDPNFPRAVAALARASSGNFASDFVVSRAQAAESARWFRASNNQAGLLRAQFEQIYAEQLTRHIDECWSDARRTLRAADQLPYSWLRIQLRLEKAVCSLLEKDDWGTDGRLSREALDLAKASHYDRLAVRANYFIADGQLTSGDISGGFRSATDALNDYWSGEMPAYLGYALYAATLALPPEFASTRAHFVLASWKEATGEADSSDDLLLRVWAHGGLANAAAVTQEPDLAEQNAAEASRLLARAPRTEATLNYLLWAEVRTALVEAQLGQFDRGIARLAEIQGQIAAHADKFLEETFYATLGELQLRNRHPALAKQAFQPAMESAERRLASLNSEAQGLNWGREAAPVYLGMTEAELVQNHTQESLEYFEWYLGAAGRAAAKTIPAHDVGPDPTSLTSRLPLLTRQTVVAFAALPDGIAIWSYDNRGVTANWVPDSKRSLQQLATRFYDLAADPKSSRRALRRDARSLYDALIAPLEPRLDDGRTLVIEADGWLAQVPFEALVDANGRYLIERSAIVRTLAQNSRVNPQSESLISADAPVLVVGSTAASQDAGQVPLPNVGAEADAVARNFHSSVELKASDATLPDVERELSAAAVFHFTGHSVVSRNVAALLLASSSGQRDSAALLTGDEFRRLDLRNLRLAVLSTCNTESGSDGSRGFNSIAAALQRAGVPHIVGSRWAVDAVATRTFVDGFYRNALSGKSVPEAVRQTSRRMIADASTSHPYYWSAFSAYGRP